MKKIFYSIATILLLQGCANNSTQPLKGNEYVSNNLGFTLAFDKVENKFYGKAVNNYFGIYTLNGANIKLELQGSTMMMGAPDEMERETKYFNNLNEINSYSISGDTLTLKGKDQEIVFNKK